MTWRGVMPERALDPPEPRWSEDDLETVRGVAWDLDELAEDVGGLLPQEAAEIRALAERLRELAPARQEEADDE